MEKIISIEGFLILFDINYYTFEINISEIWIFVYSYICYDSSLNLCYCLFCLFIFICCLIKLCDCCMRPKAFIKLCERIRATGFVKDAYRSIIEEQIANFFAHYWE